MKKYLEIHTWNGNGYSDSSCQLLEFTEEDRLTYIKNIHSNFLNLYVNCVLNSDGNILRFGTGEDDGVLTLQEYPEELVGVILEPLINDYRLYFDEGELLEKIDEMKNDLNEDQDDENEFDCVDNYYILYTKNRLENGK